MSTIQADVRTTALAQNYEQSIESPIVLDLGKAKRKRIKSLKRGRGKLAEDVAHAINQVRASVAGSDENVRVVPVVVIYKQKSRRKKRRSGYFGF